MTTQLYVRDPYGNLKTILQNFVRLEYARAENKTGWMYVDFDPAAIDTRLFTLDTRLEPWRQIVGSLPYLDGESVFFVRRWGWAIDSSGREIFRVYAVDANYLLESRIVGHYSGDAKASKTGAADDLMKAIVTEQLLGENLFPSVGRSLNTYATLLQVQSNLSAAPSLTKDFAWRRVYDVLVDLAASSYQQNGTYLVFDTVYLTPSLLEFRTYTGRRGVDHGKASGQTVVISRERLNLEQPEYMEDHVGEITYSYAGGQGTGTTREIISKVVQSELALTPFNWRELFQDARNSDTTAGITTEAYSLLRDNRYRRSLSGTILDTYGCMDGIHYRYGDVVYAEYRGQGFDAHIDALHVTIDQGRETRVNQIRAEA